MPPRVEVALQGVAQGEPGRPVDAHPPAPLPPRPRVPVLHEHVPLGEVARWKVEVGAVDRHQLGKEQGRDFRLQIVKMVAIHENASF